MTKHKQKTAFIVCLLFIALGCPLQATQPKAKKRKVPNVWFDLAREGKISSLEDLHECCDIDIYAKNWALISSSKEGHLDCVKFLVKKGADVNARDKRGRTALMLSAHEGHLDCVKFLLQQGANSHVVNRAGHTALYYGTLQKRIDIVACLDKQMAKHVTELQNCIKKQQNSTKSTEETLKNSGKLRLIIIQYWQRGAEISEIDKDIVSIIFRYGDTKIQ